MAENKNSKAKNWTFLVYPESAPDNWRDVLDTQGYVYCGCLHDSDLQDDGTAKKDHNHVIVTFDGPTTYKVMKELTDSLNSPIPQPVRNLRGMIRYLVHADNPEKYQYGQESIFVHGMDKEVHEAFEERLTDSEKKADRVNMATKLHEFIRKHGYTQWYDVEVKLAVDYFGRREELIDLLDYAFNHSYLVSKWLEDEFHKKHYKGDL